MNVTNDAVDPVWSLIWHATPAQACSWIWVPGQTCFVCMCRITGALGGAICMLFTLRGTFLPCILCRMLTLP